MQGILEDVMQDCVQKAFWNISRDSDSITFLGNLLRCSVTCTIKMFSLMFRWNLLSISFCPLSFILLLVITEQCLAASSWLLPFRYLDTSIRSSLSLLHAKQVQFPWPLVIRREKEKEEECSLQMVSLAWNISDLRAVIQQAPECFYCFSLFCFT